MKPDYERVSKLLLDTVTVLCKNGLTYEQELKVQGLIGITLDNTDVFVVHINEAFGANGANIDSSSSSSQSDREISTSSSTTDAERPPPRKRPTHKKPGEVVDLTPSAQIRQNRPVRTVSLSSSLSQSHVQQWGVQATSAMSNLTEAGNRMLPPYGVSGAGGGHLRNDVNTSAYGTATESMCYSRRDNMLSARTAADGRHLARMNAPMLLQDYPQQLHPGLRGEEETAVIAGQRLQTDQAATMESRRQTATRLAAVQHQQNSVPLGGPTVPTSSHNNLSMMQRPMNPGVMQPPLPYHQQQHKFPHPYDVQMRMFPPNQCIANAVSSVPMFPNSMGSPGCPSSSDIQQQRSQPGILSSFLRDATNATSQRMTPDYNQVMSKVVPKEYIAGGDSSTMTPSFARKSSRTRVEHIDLSNDFDNEVLLETFLSSGLTSSLTPDNASNVMTSSIVIQPDNIDMTSELLPNCQLELICDTINDVSQMNDDDANGDRNVTDNSDADADFVAMTTVQEILPVDGFDIRSEYPLNSPSDGTLPTGLIDSGQSTGSERMEESGLDGLMGSSVEENTSIIIKYSAPESDQQSSLRSEIIEDDIFRNRETDFVDVILINSEKNGDFVDNINDDSEKKVFKLIDNERELVDSDKKPSPKNSFEETDLMLRNYISEKRNLNTKKSTDQHVKKFIDYLLSKNEKRLPEEIPPSELNLYLGTFVLDIRKEDGKEYEPDSLRAFTSSIQRYLKDKSYDIDEKIFSLQKEVLKSKRKDLRQQGLGNKVNKAEALTYDEEEKLWNCHQLGCVNPQALMNTVWYFNTKLLGFRGSQENRQMLWGDIKILKDENDEEFLQFTERATKTRDGNSNYQRPFQPKIFPNKLNLERCPLKIYKMYRDKRPIEACKDESPFYLAIDHHPKDSSIWYKNSAYGICMLQTMMKRMATAAELSGKKTNNSVRKTMCTNLLHSGIAPTTIIQLSGHKNISSINSYATASTDQQKEMCQILMNPFSSSKTKTCSS